MSDVQDMSGKVCLITGATQGIGRAAAMEIARRGPTVVLVGRDEARLAEVVKEIKDKTNNQKIESLVADLSSQKSIRELAAQFLARHDRLHILVNNAGGVFTERKLTVDGFETTFAVDHLAYFLLTELLLPVIKSSAPARIVNVASAAHLRGHIDFDDLQGERNFSGFRAYGQAKLANILFTFELARRLAGTGVTANCLHPGVVSTGFGKNNSGWLKTAVQLFGFLLLSPEQGARTTVYLATSSEVEGTTGKYFAKCKEARSNRESKDPEVARRLWEVSEQMTRPR
jgi:NAD(P)-dependent dehydrogenase (short-subunit alcohol dehydrogenase family)